MMEETQQREVSDCCRTVLEPVDHVVRLGRGGRLVASAGPGAPLVPRGHGPPDPPRNVIDIAGIQRERLAVKRGAGEQIATQVRGKAGFAGQQLHTAADELAHQLPHPRRVPAGVQLQQPRAESRYVRRTQVPGAGGGRVWFRVVSGGLAAAGPVVAGVVVACGAAGCAAVVLAVPVQVPVELGSGLEQVIKGAEVGVGGDQGEQSRVADDALGGAAGEPRCAVAAGGLGGGAVAGPAGDEPVGPGPLEFGAVVELDEVGEADVDDGLDRAAAFGREKVGAEQTQRCLVERVVHAGVAAPGVLGSGFLAQAGKHGPQRRRAFGGQFAGQDAGAVQGGLQPHRAGVEVLAVILVRAQGTGQDLCRKAHQPGQIQAGPGGLDQDQVGFTAVRLVGDPAGQGHELARIGQRQHALG